MSLYVIESSSSTGKFVTTFDEGTAAARSAGNISLPCVGMLLEERTVCSNTRYKFDFTMACYLIDGRKRWMVKSNLRCQQVVP